MQRKAVGAQGAARIRPTRRPVAVQSRVLPFLLAAACLATAPAARALTGSAPAGPLSLLAGNLSPAETKHPGSVPPHGSDLRWGALGPDRDGGVRFGARLTGRGGTWTLDHSDSHWRGKATHRFRLGFTRRF